MMDGESHVTSSQSTTEYTFASLFAVVLLAEVLGLVVVHSYVVFETGGPSTFGTLRAVWIGGIVLTSGFLGAELLA